MVVDRSLPELATIRFHDAGTAIPRSGGIHVLGPATICNAPFVDYYWGSKYNALDQFVRKGVSFLPLGVLFALAGREIFATGRAYRVVAAAIAIGLVVEAGRYFLPTRSPSLTDVVIGCGGTGRLPADAASSGPPYGPMRPSACM